MRTPDDGLGTSVPSSLRTEPMVNGTLILTEVDCSDHTTYPLVA